MQPLNHLLKIQCFTLTTSILKFRSCYFKQISMQLINLLKFFHCFGLIYVHKLHYRKTTVDISFLLYLMHYNSFIHASLVPVAINSVTYYDNAYKFIITYIFVTLDS